jgi:mitochondrial fission protein ELM1
MQNTLHILILSDGKPGHYNQSLGLAEALSRLTTTQIQTIYIKRRNPISACIDTLEQVNSLTRPNLLIAAGHATHIPLLVLGIKLNVPTVVLMKPSLPAALFDLCLIPLHDIQDTNHSENIIPTIGSLHRIQLGPATTNCGLIMIGGPSKEFTWEEGPLLRAITEVVVNSPLQWHLTDSRRTPPSFLSSLASLPITLHPHNLTTRDWLPATLATAKQVWVTQDSVSMIFEALSSQASVGILPMRPVKKLSKISLAVEQLCSNLQTVFFSDWLSTRQLPAAKPLREADRCARIVLSSLYPNIL